MKITTVPGNGGIVPPWLQYPIGTYPMPTVPKENKR